jgi:hypothetical protein
VNGKQHRIDGPAVENTNGTKFWYLNDIHYEERQHPFNVFRLEHSLGAGFNSWPEDMKALFVLTYGGE